jgi:hypothetical protein
MDYDAVIAALLVALLVFFSLDFDKHYADGIHDAARHPFARFLAGIGVVVLAARNPA